MTETTNPTKAVMRASVYDTSISGTAPRAVIDLARKTYFAACETDEEFMLCIAVCNHLGVSPIDRQVFATRFKGKLVPTISHDLLMGKSRNAGFTVSGAAVYKDDLWDGFDAVEFRPLKHIQKAVGPCIGAWSNVRDSKTGKLLFGQYWPIAELVNHDSPTHKSMPGHMAKKCAEARISRLACPTMLKGTYTAEELGVGSSDDLAANANAPREPITRAAVVTNTNPPTETTKPGFDVDTFEYNDRKRKEAEAANATEKADSSGGPPPDDDGWSANAPGTTEKKVDPRDELIQQIFDMTSAALERGMSRVDFIVKSFAPGSVNVSPDDQVATAKRIEDHIGLFVAGKLPIDEYKAADKYKTIIRLMKDAVK